MPSELPPSVAAAAGAIPKERLRRWAKAAGLDCPTLSLERYAAIVASTALHEAGHVVSAWRLGVDVDFVQLRFGAGGLAGMTLRSTRCSYVESDIIQYSGVAAQHPQLDLPALIERFELGSLPPDEWWEEVDDEDVSLALHDLVNDSENDRRYRPEAFDLAAFGMAQALLRVHWHDVERVAVALLERVTLKRDAIAKLLDSQIEKRGEGVYRIRWYTCTGRVDGKRRYSSKTIRGTKKQAEKALRDVLARAEKTG